MGKFEKSTVSRRICICLMVLLFAAAMGNTALGNVDSNLTPKELLGKLIFFDSNLSEPKGQACEACHGEDVGWTGPNEASNVLRGGVYHGANTSRFGSRKPPTIAYSTFAPNFRLDNATTGAFVGGEFWDGRATGEIRGTAAEDQATGPFLNPLEMNNPNGDAVVDKVCTSGYVDLFKQVWGSNACDDKKKAFDDIAFSIVAFEASKEVTPFTSKYDAYLDGKVKLTDKEMKGLELFKGKAICNNCHIADLGPDGKHPLFMNFIYGDPGTPRNPQNPFYNQTEFNPSGVEFIDPGLAGHIQDDPNLLKYQRINYGKFRVPTLRNVDKRPNETFVKRYMHNGFFSSLQDVVHFYNTRDVLPVCGFSGSVIGKNCWPLPEVALNANPNVGHLGLTDEEEDNIVAFLKTLSDGFTQPELLSNPGFESGTSPWIFYTNGTGKFTVAPPGYEGSKSAKIVLYTGGTNIQLYQKSISLEPHTRYRLSFAANSTKGHDLKVRLIKHFSPFTRYGLDQTFNLSTGWQEFSTEFTTAGFSGTVNDGRLMFYLAPFVKAGDTYYIDDVRLEKI